MASFLDKYRTGPVRWLVYYYKGEIKVQKGYVNNNGSFVLVDKNTWFTNAPQSFMKVEKRGKVLCRSEDEIPRAKQMIKEYYIKKIDEVRDKALISLYNIQKMIKENGNR